MPKSYKVGDTTYQFPDDFDDAKVQGILTQQGIISAPSGSKPSRKDSLKGGPQNMPDDAANPAREGFWKSLGNAITAPFNMAANLDTLQPGDVLEGAGNTLVKAGSGNIAGAAGDVVGGALVGKALGSKGGELPPDPATRAAIMDRMGQPLPPAAPAAAGTGIFGGLRQAYNLYKSVKKLTPTALAEGGFEKFLDMVEGKQAPPEAPKAPAVPPEATAPPEPPARPLPTPVAQRDWRALIREAGGGPAPVETPAPKLTPAQINKLPAREAVKYLQAQRGNVQSIADAPGFKPAVEMPKAGAVEVPPPAAEAPAAASEAPATFQERGRAENAASFSKLLHETGITADLAASMDPEQWAQVKTQAKISEAKAVGQRITPEMLKQKAPSPETIKAALDELKKLEATAPPDDLASLLRQSVEQVRSRKVNK